MGGGLYELVVSNVGTNGGITMELKFLEGGGGQDPSPPPTPLCMKPQGWCTGVQL